MRNGFIRVMSSQKEFKGGMTFQGIFMNFNESLLIKALGPPTKVLSFDDNKIPIWYLEYSEVGRTWHVCLVKDLALEKFDEYTRAWNIYGDDMFPEAMSREIIEENYGETIHIYNKKGGVTCSGCFM